MESRKVLKWVICGCREPTEGCGCVFLKTIFEIGQGLISNFSGSLKKIFQEVVWAFYTLKNVKFCMN